MPLCSKCGKDNRDGSKFCQSCGSPLSGEEIPQTQMQAGPRPRKISTAELAATPCASCGTSNAPGMRFCKMCGAPLKVAEGITQDRVSCPSCGGVTPSGYKFCQHCGTPLPKEQAPQPVAAPSPPAVAPPLPAAGESQPTGVPYGSSLAALPLEASLQAEAHQRRHSDLAKAITDADTSGITGSAGTPATARPAAAADPRLDESKTPDQAAVSGAIQGAATPAAGMPGGSVKTPHSTGSPAAAEEPPQRSTVGPGAGRPPAIVATEKETLARIISVNRDGTDGEVRAITDETVDLGRVAGGLIFGDDPYLSERHCRLYLKHGRWMIQDLSSCNGVYLRSRDVVSLEHLDHVLLGKQVLVFERLSEHERDLGPAVENGVLVFGSPLRTPWARLKQLTVAGIFRDTYHLVQPRVTVGREDGDILFPDDEFMSRKHLAIALVNGQVQLQDLGSSNGTYLRIQRPYELASGTMIRVGDQLLRFDVA